MIIVDDFSTDNSYQIVLDFAKKNNRIKVFRNYVNSDAAVSRKVATGKTLVEIDPRYFRLAEVELLIGEHLHLKRHRNLIDIQIVFLILLIIKII